MANNPIQIVLDSSNFINDWDRPAGGNKKDFFEGRDKEFFEHKQKIAKQLIAVEEKLTENVFSDVAYMKLILSPSALAKSHRPTKEIFQKERTPIVGGGDLGELYVEVRPATIDGLIEKVLSAEDETRYKADKNGEAKVNPSRIRSEVGAIEEIQQYSSSDKRAFSVTQGLEWISNPQTGGAYIIELFETPPPRQDFDTLPIYKQRLFRSFENGLAKLGKGLVASRLLDGGNSVPMIGVRLEDSSLPPNVQFAPTQSSIKNQRRELNKVDLDIDRHGQLIDFLDMHPLVKKILLPPVILKSDSTTRLRKGDIFKIPSPVKDKVYPKVGIVDGGLSGLLNEWVEGRYDFLSPEDRDESHGTFIGGLLLAGNSLNGNQICKEVDGCKLIDIDILPKEDDFQSYYNNRPLEFFKELRIAVEQMKQQSDVRIFNFSLNIHEHVSSAGYSSAAKMLDRIAEEHDVIFVISAGNTHQNDIRKEWPKDATEALSILASSRNDTIKTPAESCRNISVASVNPPNLRGVLPFAPSNYSCRGPGMRVGIKPDLAHVGGAGSKAGSGLLSFDLDGNIIDGCGTSFAVPNVAKTLACLDHEIEGYTSRETLMALALHQTILPEILIDKKLKNIVKNMVGFGIPGASHEILQTNDNSITLVFANRIKSGKKMSFKFVWPPSLVINGKCKGHARLTIVSTPPFDYKYGAEFARVNIEAYLRQEHLDKEGSSYKGRLEPFYPPDKNENNLLERNLIENSFKWATSKVFAKTWKKGVGNTTNWALDVEYLAREGVGLPTEGIPFTVLLTISDPEGERPVFTEMHQMLKAMGVQIANIQTASRITSRV